jgi:prevent-host-death family protein
VKTIGAFDAKTHLSDLLQKVARGESFLITKRGKPVAALSPVNAGTRHGPKDLITDFRKRFARSLQSFMIEEINDLKEAGRR